MFHDIKKENTESIFRALAKRYEIISLDSFIKANLNKEPHLLPKKAMIITFDDGHIGNYELLPTLKKYKIPITIFLCSAIVNTKRHFWFKFTKNSEELKKISNADRLTKLKDLGFEQEREFDKPQALTKDQINEMSAHVNFQSHTRFHPCLNRCTDKESYDEIVGAKNELETSFNLNINAIAFPNGDYSLREIEIAKASGYKCALTVDFGYNSINSDPFTLKRISVNDTSDINELIVKASGVWIFFKSLFFK